MSRDPSMPDTDTDTDTVTDTDTDTVTVTDTDTDTARWRIWVDTGGTFTDALGVAPDGSVHRAKVLSSSALRGRMLETTGRQVQVDASWRLVDGFAVGATLHPLGGERTVRVIGCEASASGCVLELTSPLGAVLGRDERGLELRFDEEAPVLAARLLTGAATSGALPPLEMRLATTRGTNALLERRGARVGLLITRGFADLLRIGDQRRPHLFALDIVRPEPLTHRVVEVPERLAADGTVLEALDVEALRPRLVELLREVDAVAIALLHSWRDDRHERMLAAELERLGCRHAARSAELVPAIEILPRAETAVVDAYLGPIVGDYLRRVEESVGGSLLTMTSAGGLVRARRFRAKDSLLSGPAGGVVGAARVGRALGFRRLLAFDMGGTSTDVTRIGEDFDLRREHVVGGARVASPSLAIETVAAGGGSICRLDGASPLLLVGPRSAGAEPGPACYGAGGPLTLTDVHLLLGRLDGRRFGLPIDRDAAERAFRAIDEGLPEAPRDEILQGLLDIADERMAAAVRRISVRRGDDPGEHALVAFGGAGGLHACAVARALGVSTVLLPRDAGLLSALGLGVALLERMARRPVLRALQDLADDLPRLLRETADQAVGELVGEGVAAERATVRRRTVFLRLLGQETVLPIDLEPSAEVSVDRLERAFQTAYRERYGYAPPARALEVESLRVVASEPPPPIETSIEDPASSTDRGAVPTAARRRAFLDGSWREVAAIDAEALEPGHRLDGPACVDGRYATFVLEPGWTARVAATGTLVATRRGERDQTSSEP